MPNPTDKPLTLEEVRQGMQTLVALGILTEVGRRASDGEMIYQIGSLEEQSRALTARSGQPLSRRERRAAQRQARKAARQKGAA